MKYKYPTSEEITSGKIRECALKVCPPRKRCRCQRYDRPIVCVRKKNTTRGKRCAKFKTANIDILNQFYHKKDHYYLAWNKDTRNYTLYKNNKKIEEYGMNVSWAMDNYFELKDELQPSRREFAEPLEMEDYESDFCYPKEIRLFSIIHEER